MLKVYADEHVIALLVEALRQRGMDVVTVQERGRERADDTELLAEAFHEQRIMLTNDQDFLVLASQHAARGDAFAPIFFWPQRQRPMGQLIQSIIRAANQQEYAKACSQVFFL